MHPFRSLLCSLAALTLTVPAIAAAPITGTVTDGTNGKPSAGDTVTLIQLQQSMQEASHTTTDARGHFALQVPDEGMHLVRVTHQKANYFQPVQPGTDTVSVTVTVYDAAPAVPGVHTGVEELHIEATSTELHVVEVLQVLNESTPQRTQFGPNGYDFYLPKGALLGRTGALTQGGMPVQTAAVPLSDPGHYTFLFPIRPGETQFGISYTLPYTGKFTFAPRLNGQLKTFAVLLPTTMTLTPGPGSSLQAAPAKGGTATYIAQDVSPSSPPQFTISGAGTLPQPAAEGGESGPNANTANPDSNAPPVSNSDLAGGRGLNNPLDATGERDPWAKYKWWILSGLALLLAGAAGILLRRPSAPAYPEAETPGPSSSTWPPPPETKSPSKAHEATLAALKEELFALETERLQRRISETDYQRAKEAVELILARVLNRNSEAAVSTASRTPGLESRSEQPALTGQEPR